MIRVGTVAYLNARPLVWGLDNQPERFQLRFEVPSKCASLLHDSAVDLSLIPSIEYVHRPAYQIVPDVAITSFGPVASVAVFTNRPIAAVRTIAVDASSRTSVALLRVLCAQWFEFEPKFIRLPPDIPAMLKRCDAALVIGDPALFADHDALGVDKIDLGEEWTAMTNLPFVWAFWAGRPGVITPDDILALQTARNAGVKESDAIAREFCNTDEDQVELGARYLRENIGYVLDDAGRAGLKKFLKATKELGVIHSDTTVTFYPSRDE